MSRRARRAFRTLFVAAVFGAGYLAGGATLGQAAKLGTTITEMQKSVDDLNKSLETLNTIKAALGGG